MPDPRPATPQQHRQPEHEHPARRPPSAIADETATVPIEQRALVVRLSQEVAALRAALDLSRHRIATLEVEAAVDPVTGLYNRRAFEREVDKASAFRSRYQTPAIAVLIALDGLAGVAERHGQQIANRVLQTIGGRLRATLRSCDVAARIDPYQFVVVLWNAAPSDCQPRVDALRAAVGGMDRLLEGRVTAVSARIAAAPIESGETPAGLIGRLEPMLGSRRRGPRG